jgi:carboxyl-terminal processing protease
MIQFFSSRLKKIKKPYQKTVVGFSLFLLAVSGISFTQDYFEISKNLDIFNSLYRELNTTYVDDTKPGQLMKTGIDAMLNSLDPYTIYFPETDIEDFRYMMTGEYGGIGSTVLDIEGKIIIADPFEGFAAYKAGLRAGDQIQGVNGVNVVGKRSDEITNLLRGQAGTSVKLKVLKVGQSTPVELTISREEVKHKSVPYFGLLDNTETGYIKLTSFTENCGNEVKEALLALKAKGCKNLVLDLRSNPGGLLHEAVNIVNLFVDKGQEVVYTKGKIAEWDKTYLSVNNPVDKETPLAVLVDEYSASASEIVSGALQDLDRAVIVGQRTFGKGLVQQTKDLMYNTKVKITVAKYYIPSGRCVQALDYTHKDEEGRVEKVPDSLITAFKTKGGRIVYDGAGVMPDLKTDEEKQNVLVSAIMINHHVFNFATQYVQNKAEIGRVKDFTLSNEEYNQFLSYLKQKNFSYKTKNETELEKIKKAAEEEGSYKTFKQEYEDLLVKIKNSKDNDLQEARPIIKRLLEEEIVSRYYFQKGRLEFSLKNDSDVKLAAEVLKDNARITTILTSIEKPIKPFNMNKRF